MDAWVVTLSRTPTAHTAMPGLDEVLAEPSDADDRSLLPLSRIHLGSIEGRREHWPEWAPLLAYTIIEYGALTSDWPTFTLNDAGTVSHDIPEYAFLDEPILREADLALIATGRGEPETIERYWRIHEVRDSVARRSGRMLTHADLDQLLALPPGEAKRVLGEYPSQRLALAPWLAIEPVRLPDDAVERESVWDAWVRRGVVVGLLLDEPIGLADAGEWPTAADGTRLPFIGQFKADNITAYVPGFVYWLFWSPAEGAVVQLDAHD